MKSTWFCLAAVCILSIHLAFPVYGDDAWAPSNLPTANTEPAPAPADTLDTPEVTPPDTPPQSSGDEAKPSAPEAAEASPSGMSEEEAPSAAAPDPALAVESANTFGLALFKRLTAEAGNVLLSPYALQDPLAFLYAASDGETQMEIRAALQYPQHPGSILASVATLRRDTERREALGIVRASSSLWVQQGIPLDADLITRAERQVGLAAGRIDLVDGVERARSAMNAWSQFQTGGFISEPLPAGELRRDALVILLNTFHIRRAWRTPFPEAGTTPATFTTPAGTVRIPMMRQRDRFAYYDAGHTQFLRLPLAGRDHELLLFLPRDAAGMERFLQRLTFPELERWESRMWTREVDLHLPRFSINTGHPLIPDLRALGLEDAFSPRADFSPLTGDVRVSVDRFRHLNSFVFAEAGISMPPLTAPPPSPATPDATADAVAFHVNRPFVFLLRDSRSGILLAMGRIDSPAGTPVQESAEPEAPAPEVDKLPLPTFRRRPGFGPWDFGMPIDVIPGTPGGPYRYIRQTRQFMTENARWNMTDGHTATLSFNEEGNLSGVRLQLYTGRNPDAVAEPLLTLIRALQERYTGVILPEADLPADATDDPAAISAAMRARVERLGVERPHAPAETSLYPRYQPPETWISGHLLYEESIGYAVFLQYQWDPRFPGTPLPEPTPGEQPAP